MNIQPSPTSPKVKQPDKGGQRRIKKIFYISTLSIIFGFLAGMLGEITIFAYLTTPFKLPIIGEIQIIDQYSPERDLIIRRENNGDSDITDEKIMGLSPSIVSIFSTKPSEKDKTIEMLYFPPDQKGQGIFVTNDGWIATVKSAVKDIENITVINNDGETSNVEKRVDDPSSDFVFLKTRLNSSHIATFISPENIELLQNIHLLNVFNNQLAQNITRKQSTVINFDSSLWTGTLESSETFNNHWVIADDAFDTLNGTPVFTNQGKLVGLMNEVDPAQETKLILPTYIIEPIIKEIPNKQTIERTRFGVTYLMTTHPKFLKSQNTGAWITAASAEQPAISVGSPAEKAGLKIGDLIVKINNQTLNGQTRLNDIIQRYKPNESINLVIERNGEIKNFTITLEKFQ